MIPPGYSTWLRFNRRQWLDRGTARQGLGSGKRYGFPRPRFHMLCLSETSHVLLMVSFPETVLDPRWLGGLLPIGTFLRAPPRRLSRHVHSPQLAPNSQILAPPRIPAPCFSRPIKTPSANAVMIHMQTEDDGSLLATHTLRLVMKIDFTGKQVLHITLFRKLRIHGRGSSQFITWRK